MNFLLSNETKKLFLAGRNIKLWTKKHDVFFTGHPVYIYNVPFSGYRTITEDFFIIKKRIQLVETISLSTLINNFEEKKIFNQKILNS